MTPRILATRTAIANAQMAAAATVLAQARNLPVDGINAVHRDPAVQQLLRLEAVANLLGLLATPEAALQPKRTRKDQHEEPRNEL